jgi:hypothetical protein
MPNDLCNALKNEVKNMNDNYVLAYASGQALHTVWISFNDDTRKMATFDFTDFQKSQCSGALLHFQDAGITRLYVKNMRDMQQYISCFPINYKDPAHRNMEHDFTYYDLANLDKPYHFSR